MPSTVENKFWQFEANYWLKKLNGSELGLSQTIADKILHEKRLHPQSKSALKVDEIIDTFCWKSVMFGVSFEEITDPVIRQQAIQGLVHKWWPFTSFPNQHPWHGNTDLEKSIDIKIPTIVYKMVIGKFSGRFDDLSPGLLNYPLQSKANILERALTTINRGIDCGHAGEIDLEGKFVIQTVKHHGKQFKNYNLTPAPR